MTPVLGIIASSNQQGRAGGPVGAFDSLATVTVPSGGVASITFAGIPSDYRHLQIRGIARNTGYDAGGARQQLYIQFNGDTNNNYNSHGLIGNGATASSLFESTRSAIIPSYGIIPMSDASTGMFGAAIIDVLDYASTTKAKTVKLLGGVDTNDSSNEYSNLGSGAWNITNVINSITLFPQAGAWAEYTSYALYGVK